MAPTEYLEFKKSETDQEIKDIFNFNAKAFADSQDFTWTEANIKNEIKDGWKLYSVKYDDDIAAALFLKIKDFYEKVAKENNLNKIVNYCPFDNFRMISLNEGHDYKKTGKKVGPQNEMLEWEKKLN